MSASRQEAPHLPRASDLSTRVKDSGRAALAPVVRLAMALHLTPNTITVIGLGITLVAAVLIANGMLLLGAGILVGGSLLDAVDGALARATVGGTAFGGFLDSTLDRIGEAVLFTGIAAWLLSGEADATWPVLALIVALAGSILVSYAHARAQGIGVDASVGLAQRPERLVIVIAGVALAGLGFSAGLLGAIVLVAALSVATLVQRIWHVWRLTEAAPTRKEN